MNAKSCPKVVVLVLNWNGKKDTYECVKSLMQVDYPNFEIIIIDNKSYDGSQTFFKQVFPEITLLENASNMGFGGGYNIGIKEAINRKAVYIVCLNNDVIIDINFLIELVKIGELSVKIGGLCPMEYYYDKPDIMNYAGGIVRPINSYVFGHGKPDEGQYNQVKETWMLCGPAMILKTKMLQDIGLFDEDYFYGPEDQDLTIRALEAGYRLVFVPKAKLWHKRRGATGGKITPLTAYFQIRNRILFLRKHTRKLEAFISFMYLGIFYLPSSFIMFLVREKGRCIDAALKGVLWHLNRNLVPTDPKMAQNLK